MLMRIKRIGWISALLLLFTLPVSGLTNVPYATYTYSVEGEAQLSPHAYIPAFSIASAQGMDVPFSSPSDVVADKQDNLYIADTGNNRVVVLDGKGQFKAAIASFENEGAQDSLNGPKGVFVAEDGTIYISDTGNQRILRFSDSYQLLDVVDKPESPLFASDFEFRPKSLVVDKVGRIFVAAENMNMGILVLDTAGNFKNFFGAQKVEINPVELFWRRFMTDEQIDRTQSFIPTEYDGITVDEDGFLFVTSSSIDPVLQYGATVGKDMSSQYAPVKRFGAAGTDVLARQGEYPPSGDISVSLYDKGPSAIVDCACGPYGTYTLVDAKRNKLFTYDSDGNLLYAFGGSGSQLGMFEGLQAAVCLSDRSMVCLDSINGELTFFTQTEYGALLFEVMQLHSERRYSEETAVWQKVLLANNNLDYAYVGLGKALIKAGESQKAMELFRTASNKAQYSLAFKDYRTQTLSKFLLFIPVVLVAVVFGLIMLFRFAARYNRRRAVVGAVKRTVREEVIYGLHTLTHPFDGFWDLTHEGRGSLRGGLLILALTCGALMLRSGCSGYLFSDGGAVWSGPLVLLLFLLLFVMANWSITSLTNGKGTAKQVLLMSCYSLVPLFLLTLPQVALSHVLLLEESAYITSLSTLGYVWTGLLLFAGIITIHQYSLPKALLTALLTLLGMIVIVFLALMFFNLLEPMVMFFSNYYKEVFYRF